MQIWSCLRRLILNILFSMVKDRNDSDEISEYLKVGVLDVKILY
jgi:hypothetical protein